MGSKFYRHRRRGSLYEMIGLASVQGVVEEGNYAVIYRGEDDRLWVRDRNEFFDGRFEPADQLELPMDIPRLCPPLPTQSPSA